MRGYITNIRGPILQSKMISEVYVVDSRAGGVLSTPPCLLLLPFRMPDTFTKEKAGEYTILYKHAVALF